MGSIRCVKCDGTAVDHEGYCWTCEFQNDVVGEAPPDWLVPSEDPFIDFPPLPPQRSMAGKIALVLVPPLVTFLVMAAGIGAYFAFRYVDALMTTPPQVIIVGSGFPDVDVDVAPAWGVIPDGAPGRRSASQPDAI